MTIDDTATDGKADSTAFVLVAAHKTLEGLKDPVRILLGKTNPFVLDKNLYLFRKLFCEGPDLGRLAGLRPITSGPGRLPRGFGLPSTTRQ
jgi:hypothetical protein